MMFLSKLVDRQHDHIVDEHETEKKKKKKKEKKKKESHVKSLKLRMSESFVS